MSTTQSRQNRAELLKEIEKLRGQVGELENAASSSKEGRLTLGDGDDQCRQIVEFIPDSLSIFVDERFVFINPNGVKMLGARTVDEVLGHQVWDFCHPDFRNLGKSRYRQCLEGNDFLPPAEFELMRLNGEVINVESSARLITHNGRRAILAVWRDISHRKQAEKDLRESESKYRRLYDSMMEAFASSDMSGRIQETNRAFQTLLGYSEEELKQLNYTDLTLEKWHAFESEIIKNQVIPRGYSDVFEKEYRKKDGTILPVELRTFLLRGASGQPIGMWAIIRDITERKRAEKKLEEWRQLMDFIIRHDPNAIAVYDENLRYVFVSERYLDDYKLQDRNIIGKHHYEVFPEMPERWKQVHQRVLAGAVERAGEDRFERLDGSVDYNRWECRPWYRLDGSVGGMITYTEVITERKRAEEALRKSEERFRQIVENANEGIWAIDGQQRVVFVNQRIASILGYSPEEMIGRGGDSFIFEEDLQDHNEKMKRRQRGESAAYERRLLCKDGKAVWTIVSASPIMDAEGRFAGSFGMFTDITERKQAEEALRESEDRFRMLVESAPMGIFTTISSGKVLSINLAMARILGFPSPEEALERYTDLSAQMYVHAERRDEFLRVLRDFGRVEDFEFQARTAAGRIIWLSMNARVSERGEDGSFIIEGFAIDITERKQAEENLRLSQARYRTLVENIPQRVLLKDRESNYISINQTYGRAFGLNPEDVIGKSDYDIHPRNLADKFRQEDRLVMETGESREFQEENVEDGKKRFLHKVKVPVRDSMGKIIGVLSAISDITERLQLEEQLRHSQKMEAVGRLAGGVAHDFNNLLTVIGGHTEMALTRIDKSNPLRDNLQEVKIAADRASSLTRQLLAFSRRQVMEIQVLNLNTVIRDTEKMLRRLLGEDVAVITQLSENPGLVKADPGQIEQVLTNLAVNARDAMAQGGRLVIATDNLEITEGDDPTHIGLKPGRYVRISVSDTGHGMNPEVMSKIFEPFFTTKEQGKGTGLGLSTVFGIVKQSGGEIRVHSELEKGTTFGIILPRVEEAESVIERKDLKEPPRGAETVLIIEDEKSVLKMATQLLKNQGYQILAAHGSEDAMRVFEEHSGPIDLVLTDVVMPVCRGPALVERLKQLRENFKVLYMSGYTDGGVGDLGVLRRGDNFIQKPFTLESLAGKVRSVLDGE
jgi:PAS domain S-box-containing protein